MNATLIMASFQTVKGFRDFFPEDCARRNYIFQQWRSLASRYGFAEYEGPLLESTDLYRKKSGEEITQQLFCFTTKGDEEVSLRPEVTPTLARMAAARQRDYSKPIKWFQIGRCFRYERPGRGRLREFYQFNVDIMGESSPAADAELIAMSIDVVRIFGLCEGDFALRLSDRRLWQDFQKNHVWDEAQSTEFLQIIDKIERTPEDVTDTKLKNLGSSLQSVQEFMASVTEAHPVFAELRANLEARGLWQYVRIDPSIVRGLAYYTGAVFEVFDLKHNLRAIAGGGRYDQLIGLLSDGAVNMPACGFAMGDVVLGELIKHTPEALNQATAWTQQALAADVYMVIADETQRGHALKIASKLRESGLRVDYALTAQKVGKQFQAAESAKARFAIVLGSEYPTLIVKNLSNREQMEVPAVDIYLKMEELMKSPVYGKLLA